MYNVSDTMTSLSMDSDIFSTVGLNSLQDKGVSYKKAVDKFSARALKRAFCLFGVGYQKHSTVGITWKTGSYPDG